MNSLNFPDTNVWLALVWSRHSHAEAAREWFESCDGERFLFCRFTQLALLRWLTTKAVMGRDTKTMTQAWDLYGRCCADDRIAFLSEPEGLDVHFRALSKGHRASPKVWADAYLGAFTAAAGLTLITFDKAFRTRAIACRVLPSPPL
jgi:toxin-antitoxin system PIN domain toxin